MSVAGPTFLLIAGVTLLGCRDRYAHALRPGTLVEVGATRLSLYHVDGPDPWKLGIANEARDGACLQLGALRVTVDGVPQQVRYVGGRSVSRAKHDLGPVDGTDYCDAAVAVISVPSDPARPADVVEVTDGTATLRAEFPNVLSQARWAIAPPPRVRAGASFEVRVAPGLARGADPTDPPNLAGASIALAPGRDAKLAARVLSGGAVVIDVPASAPAGHGTLRLVSSQRGVGAKSCTAAACIAWSEVVLEAPIEIAP